MIDRLLSMPVTAPLKAMLTGVELLLAKAQVGAVQLAVQPLDSGMCRPCAVFCWDLSSPEGRSPTTATLLSHGVLAAHALLQQWEETAARHVSLAPQLAPLSALATRWRRLELGAWRGLLDSTRERAAAVAHQVGRSLHTCTWLPACELLSPPANHLAVTVPAPAGLVPPVPHPADR